MTGRRLRVWLEQYPSEHTRRAYRSDVAAALEELGELARVSVEDVNDYLATLTPGRRRRAQAAVRSYLQFGRKAGWWERAPALALRVDRPRRLPIPVPSERQVADLFVSAGNVRDRRLLALLYYGGLRVAEAVSARREALDGAVLRVVGKRDRERAIRLPLAVTSLLESAPDYFVHPLRSPSRALSTRHARTVVVELAAGVGLNLSPHGLRHAHATHALRRGCSLDVIQHHLGHTTIATTGAYLHALPEEGSSLFLPPLPAETP